MNTFDFEGSQTIESRAYLVVNGKCPVCLAAVWERLDFNTHLLRRNRNLQIGQLALLRLILRAENHTLKAAKSSLGSLYICQFRPAGAEPAAIVNAQRAGAARYLNSLLPLLQSRNSFTPLLRFIPSFQRSFRNKSKQRPNASSI